MDNPVAITFIICLTVIVILSMYFKHIRIQREENNIHDEIIQLSNNQKEIAKFLFEGSVQSNPPPDRKFTIIDGYKKQFGENLLEENQNIVNGVITPVRNNRKKDRKLFSPKKRSE